MKMKKLTMILCGIVMLFAACKKTPDNLYTLNGKLDDANLNGCVVYLFDGFEGTVLDSTTIENGTFVFSDTISTATYAVLRTSEDCGTVYRLDVVLEPGAIYADMVTDSLSGTPLNEELHTFTAKMAVLGDSMNEAYEQLMSADSTQMETAQQEFETKYDALMAEYNDLLYSSMENNKTNILGVYFVSQMQEVSLEKLNSLLEGASAEVLNHSIVKNTLERLQKLENSKPGNHYIDLNVIDFATGNTVKLSDYIEGKIALVDFWASWCRPCRGEIPNIANIHQKYGDKVVVVSLNVWDEMDKQAAAIQEMNMNWLQLTDTTKNATDSYGINGIPQIILIGADGTILARDLREDGIEKAVIEALGK